MQIKIISDGTAHNTQVISTETGEKLDNVVGICWSISPRGKAAVSLMLVNVPVEIAGETVEEPDAHL